MEGEISLASTDGGTYWTLVLGPWYSPRPMPDGLNALVAFVAEHQRCGDLDGGKDGGYVWIACSCGARVAHPASCELPGDCPSGPSLRRWWLPTDHPRRGGGPDEHP